MKLIQILLLFSLTSCTLAFNNIRTEGTASDMIDEEQSPKNDVVPTLNVSGVK